MKPISIKLIQAVVCFLFSSASLMLFAAPDIKTVTFLENEAGDQLLQLDGSGFKQGPEVVFYATFSEGVAGSNVALDGPEIGSWIKGNGRYMADGAGNMGFAANKAALGEPPVLVIQRLVFPKQSAEVFASYSIYMPPGTSFPDSSEPDTFSGSSSWKLAWLMDGENGFQNRAASDLCIPTHTGAGRFSMAGNSGGLHQIRWGQDWWDFDSTNYISTYLKPALQDPDQNSGEIFFQAVNVKYGLYNELVTNKPAAQSGTSFVYDRMNIPGWWRPKGTNFQAVYDNIYVAIGSNVRARLEITDNQEYQKATKIISIPFESWSNEQVLINLSKAKLASLDSSYLFLTDSEGVRTAVGALLCFSCPKPPLLQ